MARRYNTTAAGSSFSQKTIADVWEKAKKVTGVDGAKKRKDACGAWITHANYGKTVENGTGWEIDHIKPVAKGGTDALSNLQPLQWENNRHKGDKYPSWSCLKSAKED